MGTVPKQIINDTGKVLCTQDSSNIITIKIKKNLVNNTGMVK